MSQDFIDSTFSDLYYPNSKRKRREPELAPVKSQTDWEDDFTKKTLPNGKEVHMYTIGALAKALGRSVKTLRAWMDEDKLPQPPYRLPSTTGVNGKEYAGRRLYSKAMVEATVDIFSTAGLLHEPRVDWSVHRQLGDKIAEAWEQIRAQEMNAQGE